MSFGYVGIQFGFALQNANMSRIFETLGAKVENIPILWIAAPVSGLLIQPIIGHMSDKTWNRLGRRKPYFLGGAILSSLALLIMPNSPSLWIAAGMLWMMDGSINVTMQPFRAFIGDMLPDEQRTKGFAVQTFFIGISSVVASALPYLFTNWLHIANTAPEGQIPPSVKWSFYIGGVVFLLAVLWTIFSVKEYSPEEQEEFNAHETDAAAREGSEIKLNTTELPYRRGVLVGGWVAVFLSRLLAALGQGALYPVIRRCLLRGFANRICRSLFAGQSGRHGRNHLRLAEHAQNHETTCPGDVVHLVRAVRHVHLHHVGGDELPLRNHGSEIRFIQ